MSETRYNEDRDCWEVVTRIKFESEASISEMQDLHGVEATKQLVSSACETNLIMFARELAKTGVDKNLIAEQIVAHGVDKDTVGIALGLDNPETA